MKKHSTVLVHILAALLVIVMMFATSCSKAAGDVKNGNSAYNEDFVNEKDLTPSAGMLDIENIDKTQKLIRTCAIDAETRDFDAASAALGERISQFGGYIESQSSTGSSYGSRSGSRRLMVVVRIPAEKFGDFIFELGSIMNVTSSSSNVENVTETYYDAEARLATLKAERESLQKMMASIDNAREYDFWLTMQKRLSEVEQDIASLEARLRSIDNRVTYATVTLTLREVVEFTPSAKPSFGERISKAFSSSWKNFAQFWQDFAVFTVSLLPAITVFAVIVAVIIIIVAIAKKKKGK